MNNHRLSKSSEESLPREVCSGDIVQFGVDVLENTRKGRNLVHDITFYVHNLFDC